MAKKKNQKYTIKSYKTIKGRKLFFIKSKAYIKSCYFNHNQKFFIYKSDDPRNTSCSIRFKYSIEDLKNAEKQVVKEKSKKKKLWSWLFVLLNIVVVVGIVWYQFKNEDVASFDELLALNPNWKYLIVAILLMFSSQIIESFKCCHLLWSATHRFRPFLSYKSCSLCRYYDAITPMSTGGEPFQIFYLKNRGVRGEVATSVPIVKSLFWQISNTILGIILLVFNSNAYIGSEPIVVTIAWISIAVNALVLGTILFLSVSKKVGPRIVIGILKLLSKMHIIKNYQLTFRKVMRFVINYQNCMRSFASNFFTVIFQLILAVLEIFASTLIPYFIYRTFVPVPTLSAIDIVTKTFICNMVSLIIPIPGGSGTAELSFLAMFTSLFTERIVVWAMLIWRILTYYSIILRGITITIYDGVYGNKESERLVKSGYFTEKIHFSVIKKRRKASAKENLKLKDEQINLEMQNKSENTPKTQKKSNQTQNKQAQNVIQKPKTAKKTTKTTGKGASNKTKNQTQKNK